MAALEFDDPEAARETLKTLALEAEHPRSPACTSATATLFAGYRQDGESGECPPSSRRRGHPVRVRARRSWRATALRGRQEDSARVLLRSDLAVLARRGQHAAGDRRRAAGARARGGRADVVAAAGDRLRAGHRARQHRRRGDSRAATTRCAPTRTTDDELGELVDAFNRMLERIESRETELSRANDELRREVAERRRAEQERAELLVREREANRLKDEFLGHAVARAAHAAQRDPRLDETAARQRRAARRRSIARSRRSSATRRCSRGWSRICSRSRASSAASCGSTTARSIWSRSATRRSTRSGRPPRPAASRIERHFDDARRCRPIGDPDRLQQVIWNLLSNAVKFTPSRRHASPIAARAHRRDRRDRRHATPASASSRRSCRTCSRRFRQADASTTRAHGGLGLGLSIVQQLVELHGGEVLAASDGRDRGATFTVHLPVRVGGAPSRRTSQPRRVDSVGRDG